MVMDAVTSPVVVALEGGADNSALTSECCEAVLRVLCGERPPLVAPKALSPSTESVIRTVMATHKSFWPKAFRFKKGFLDAYFQEARSVGQEPVARGGDAAPRISKRKSVAPAFADEETSLAKRKGVLPPPKAEDSAKSDRKREAAKRRAERQAAQADAMAQVASLEKSLKMARRKQREAEEETRRVEALLGAAKAEAARLAAEASSSGGGSKEDDSSSSEDDSNGTANPKGVMLWSHKVKCEAGRRVWAQHGDEPDALWFRATVIGVRRSDIGQWVDVQYDDGEREMQKDIKRVKALDDTPSDSSSEDEDEQC